MVADQNHSSDISSEQGVILSTETIAQLNAEVRNIVFSIREKIMKQLEDCHPQYNILKKRVRRLEKDVYSLKDKLDDPEICVDREAVVDLIHEIVPSLISKKGLKGVKDSSYSSESS